jgi:alkyl hydroperoxide reductase subunit AhpC
VYDKFAALDTEVIALAQEDNDIKKHALMMSSFDPKPKFKIVADLERKKTKNYDRTTAYLIDKEGIVRQIFPMMIHHRPSWDAILGEVEKLQ